MCLLFSFSLHQFAPLLIGFSRAGHVWLPSLVTNVPGVKQNHASFCGIAILRKRTAPGIEGDTRGRGGWRGLGRTKFVTLMSLQHRKHANLPQFLVCINPFFELSVVLQLTDARQARYSSD